MKKVLKRGITNLQYAFIKVNLKFRQNKLHNTKINPGEIKNV